MHSAIAKPIDWLAIQFAKRNVYRDRGCHPEEHLSRQLLQSKTFFGKTIFPPEDIEFTSAEDFRFASPLPSAWRVNNTVYGKFFTSSDWQSRPTVILVHGWKAELSYYFLFPWIAKQAERLGINVLMFQLPFHGRRTPAQEGRALNFISSNLLQTIQAAQQTIIEIRTLIAWLQSKGNKVIGLWGASLGGWLAGLTLCVEPAVQFGVLVTPVSRMDIAINKLPFCAPVRRSLQQTSLTLDQLNLPFHQPSLPPDRILIVESVHDLFVDRMTVEELWRSWKYPEIWRVPLGHITVLMSLRTIRRTIDWIRQTTGT